RRATGRQLAHEPLIAIPRIVIVIQVNADRGVAGGRFGPLIIERDGVALAVRHEVRAGQAELDYVGPTAVVGRKWRSICADTGAEIPALVVAEGRAVGTSGLVETLPVPAAQPAVVKAGASAISLVRREPRGTVPCDQHGLGITGGIGELNGGVIPEVHVRMRAAVTARQRGQPAIVRAGHELAVGVAAEVLVAIVGE